MYILAINEGFDSSVTVLKDGRILLALQEERVTRKKNEVGLPTNAIGFALNYLKLKPTDFAHVCLSNLHSPTVSKAAFLEGYNAGAKFADKPLSRHSRDLSLQAKRLLPQKLRNIKRNTSGAKRNEIVENRLIGLGFTPKQFHRTAHHFNHAAAVYYGLRKNPHEKHLVLTLDGGGDYACSHVYIAQNGKLELIASTDDGHSIGNIYSRITHFMGMTPHEHEYKLMGLAAYMKDKSYVTGVMDKIRSYVDLSPENPLCFKSPLTERTYLSQWRYPKDFNRIRFDNLASGLQTYTEDLMLRWAKAAVQITGIKNVLCSGGVFMNVKANKRIAELPEVEYFDVFPSCGDETLPFGAAWAKYAMTSSEHNERIVFDNFCLGPEANFDLATARDLYKDHVVFTKVSDPEKHTAQLLSQGHIVARCSGPMEFGARALGNRSILADPSRTDIVPEINKMIKQRDFWMPFAPAVLEERAQDYIKIPKSLQHGHVSPYMMHTFDTTDQRGDLISGTHAYDHTARAQVVSKAINPKFHSVISAFQELTGRGSVLNTSFNLHGYPIVTGVKDAIEVMLGSSLKHLMVDEWHITKK